MVVDEQFTAYQTTTIQFIPNYSVGFMLVQRGQLVDDVTGGNSTTYGTNKIGWFATVKKVACSVKDTLGRFSSSVQVSGASTGATAANQKIIDIIDTAIGFAAA